MSGTRVNVARARRGVVLIDAIVGTVLLGMALVVVLGLSGRAVTAQARGEELRTAAMLIDEQLNLVLARGADGYESRFATRGQCDEPFSRFEYELQITGGQSGEPYDVSATVSWMSGGRRRSETVRTMIAARLGDEPNPDRRPTDQVDRMQ